LFTPSGATATSGPHYPYYRGFMITHTHTHTPHTVGLLCTNDQPHAETSIRRHTTLTRGRHPCPGRIRTHNLSKRAAANTRLRPCGHWERQ